MMFASKITINDKPQKVRYTREIKLPEGLLTLDDIAKHLKDGEKFGFFQREEGALGLPVDYISIEGYRYETDEELQKRVNEEKKYNEGYDKFHTKRDQEK